jgi:cyclic pyranopterin phosphate synthase
MPEADYVWLPREAILTFEEIARLVHVFATLGVTKVRLTGGEPLLREDVAALVALLRVEPCLTDLSLTTNGILLARDARALRAAGLGRVTVSLDTLRPERLLAFSRSPRHADIVTGVTEARRAGFDRIKVNTVVVRGFNDDELGDLIEFGRGAGVEIRFIEYMDVGGATRWSREAVVPQREILATLARRYGPIEPLGARGAAPAERFRLPDGTTFGIIASVTAPFCGTCDRSRLTADGTWFLCLYAGQGSDLRTALRTGASDEDVAASVREAWTGRDDRGAEARLALGERGALYQLASLRADPHREMHTRGG